MANNLTGNPWKLDGSSMTTVLFPGWIKVRHFEFAAYAAATDTVSLGDRTGRVVWNASGTTDKQEVRSGTVGWINGLQELTHTNGTVLVYIE